VLPSLPQTPKWGQIHINQTLVEQVIIYSIYTLFACLVFIFAIDSSGSCFCCVVDSLDEILSGVSCVLAESCLLSSTSASAEMKSSQGGSCSLASSSSFLFMAMGVAA
jgi:hypothetical protein